MVIFTGLTGFDMDDIMGHNLIWREQLSRDEDKPCWWIPFGFPRRKWIPLIDRHMGLVNDVIYCDNLGKKWVSPY